MARYGYGLLLPDIRASYHLRTDALGLIAAGGYAAYLLATALVAAVAVRTGARRLVLAGGACAVVGMALVGLTHSAAGLAVGIFVGGASAGLVFPPFSDVVAGTVAPERRQRTLAAVSSGTGWGVAVAAPVAIVLGSAWRRTWLVWAALAALATMWAALVLPADRPPPARAPTRMRASWFLCRRSGPLLLGALLVGLGASVVWTFAVELLSTAGGARPVFARSFLIVVGVAGIGGTLAGDLTGRLGLRRALALTAGLLAVSIALVGSSSASPAGIDRRRPWVRPRL